jgi:photosystem II stability/assembly factor-like uncharacterized protein
MATRTRPPKRPTQYPKKRSTPAKRRSRWLWPAAVAALLVAVGVALAVALRGGGGGERTIVAAAGLPNTPDYHSLLVSANDARVLTLGTHDGLWQSRDGGLTWTKAALGGQDAMNLGRAVGDVVWTAGHDVFARSEDGGQTWEDVRPEGLPHLDIHGFAVDPRAPNTLWAALAGEGLYRSTDGGRSFELVTREIGPGVMALAVAADGRVLAGEMERGLFVSDDDGKNWQLTLETGLMGVAVNPDEPEVVVATGPGILRSQDGGRVWKQVLALDQGAGPVAWAPSKPATGYVVGFDRSLYKTTDAGRSWAAVEAGGAS